MTETTSIAPGPDAVAAAQTERRRTLKLEHVKGAFARYKILALVVAIAIIWALFTELTQGDFLTARNLSNLLRQMAINGMVASGDGVRHHLRRDRPVGGIPARADRRSGRDLRRDLPLAACSSTCPW